MIVVVTIAKVMFLVFCSDDGNSNRKVNKKRTIYGKLIGNGPMMDNYVRWNSSCNNDYLG